MQKFQCGVATVKFWFRNRVPSEFMVGFLLFDQNFVQKMTCFIFIIHKIQYDNYQNFISNPCSCDVYDQIFLFQLLLALEYHWLHFNATNISIGVVTIKFLLLYRVSSVFMVKFLLHDHQFIQKIWLFF